MVMQSHSVSAAFFCPRARRPRDDYVADLRSYLAHTHYGTLLLEHVSKLQDSWPLFADSRPDFQSLPHAQKSVQSLVDWSKGGPTTPVCETGAGLIALPLLLVLQLGQYLRYLEVHNVSHEAFLCQVGRIGGIHGFCGGSAAALAVACAEDEAGVIQNAAVLLRVMLGVGAATDAAGDWELSAPTTLAVRLKYEGQGDDLLKQFPGVSASSFPSMCNLCSIHL